MLTKTEELSIVIDKILEQRQTGKKVQRQQILRECKEAGVEFVVQSKNGQIDHQRTLSYADPIEVE